MTDRLDMTTLGESLGDFEVGIEDVVDGTLRVTVSAEQSAALLRRLREAGNMERLSDLTAIDRGGVKGRFELVYLLASTSTSVRLRIHVALDDEAPTADSVASLWPAADWLEREVFDLFGIAFRAHPNLRRILLEPDFEGAPLRKDHPRRTDRPLPEKVLP